HRLQQCDKPALAHRLDHQAVAVAVHDRLVARQFEIDGNANRLVAAVAEQADVARRGHCLIHWHMPRTYASERRTARACVLGLASRRNPIYDHCGHMRDVMRKIQLKDAKANLSAVVDRATRGEPSVITRHGKPEAVVLGIADWERLSRVPSFGRLLMSVTLEPGDLLKRSRASIRETVM